MRPFIKLVFILFLTLRLPFASPAQDWKKAAQAAIDAHRKAPLTLHVTGVNGIDTQDISVSIKMREHAFAWGSIISIPEIRSILQKGYTLQDAHPYLNHLRYFNNIGAENAAKWKQWLDPANRLLYLQTIDWLNTLGIQSRTHATIWPSIRRWNAVPDTLLNATDVLDKDGNIVKPKLALMRDIIKGHIQEQTNIMQAKGIKEIDLINELIHENDIVTQLMQLPASEHAAEHSQWYRWAHETAPDIKLIANEYDLFQSGNNFHLTFVEYIRKMLSLGAPVHGVGMQGHFFSTVPNFNELKKRLDEVAVLGLPMAVTEFDMVSNSYEEMERVLYAVFSQPLMTGFTMWGAWDGRQWRNNSAMFTSDWRLKPSGQAWFDLVKKQWWTDTTFILNQVNPLEIRAFQGEYDVFVTRGDRVIHRRFDLPKEGQSITIDLAEEGFAQPSGTLIVEGGKSEFYTNEPIRLSVLTADTVSRIIYYNDDFILADVPIPPYDFVFPGPAEGPLRLKAKVYFVNGYVLETAEQTIQIDNSNVPPQILSVFPTSGSPILQTETTRIYVNVIDPDKDPLQITLLNEANEVIAAANSEAVIFEVPDLSLGSTVIRIMVQDSRFGQVEQRLTLNLIGENAPASSRTTIANAIDDIEEKADRNMDVNGDMDLGEKLGALRFAQAGIPPNALIDSSFVQFVSEKPNQTGITRIVIQGETGVEPEPFTAAPSGLSTRKRTSALVNWSPPDWHIVNESGPAQRTPDLKWILTELIKQPGWSAQTPVHLFFDFRTSESKRSAYGYDQSQQYAPLLEVYYRLDIKSVVIPNPVNVSFNQTQESGGVVSWDLPATAVDVQGYRFFINGQEVPRILPAQNFPLTNLNPDSLYRIAVQTVGPFGMLSGRSEPLEIQLMATHTDDIYTSLEIDVFPNPATDELWMGFKQASGGFSLSITDLSGRIVKTYSGGEGWHQLSLNGLPPAVYFLYFQMAEGSRSIKKLIKH